MQCHSGGGGKESSGVERPTESQGDPVQTKTKQENKTKISKSFKTTNSSLKALSLGHLHLRLQLESCDN